LDTPPDIPTMSCRDVTEQLYLFVSDELDGPTAGVVTKHLTGCASCRKALAETIRIAGVLSSSLPRMPLRYYSAGN